jgi:hypothetical protein
MTDEDAPALDRQASPSSTSFADNLPGQTSIVELLDAQSSLAPRAIAARMFGVTPLSVETRALYQAAVGEIRVGEALEAMGEGWEVIHALPVDSENSDIDHLAIGPSGVYIIATRNHSRQVVWASQRTLMVGGIRFPDIRNMEYEMGRVERLLSTAIGRAVEVSGILAVVDPKSLTVRQKHRDVEVLAADQLESFLTMRRRVLSPEDVRELAAAASKPETWHPDVSTAVDTADLAARFAALRLEVARAWRLQLTWAGVISIIAAGGFLAVTYVILLTSLGMLAG